MRFTELLEQQETSKFLSTVQQCCQQFICESKGLPLFKGLPFDSSIFREVKVRHRNKNDAFIESFNRAFINQHGISNIYQRAIIANGSYVSQCDQASYYVFPTNGYKYLYNETVTSTSQEYRHTFQHLIEQTDDVSIQKLLSELVSYTYISTALDEGIQSGAEILIFGINKFYAIRQDTYPEYYKLYNTIRRT
jgi:hypothetical protein